MSVLDTGGNQPNSSGIPTPGPIAPNAATWHIIIGALFGLVTMVGLFAFAYLASIIPQLCSSFQFQLLAGGFALGAALAGGFIGGGAGAQGKADGTGFSLAFGLTGGAAVLIAALVAFSIYAPKGCEVLRSEELQINLQNVQHELASTKARLDQATADLSTALTQKTTAEQQLSLLRAESQTTQTSWQKSQDEFKITKTSLDQANTDLSTALTQKATAEQQASTLSGQLDEARANLRATNDTLSKTSASLQTKSEALASMTADKNAALSANATTRADIRRLARALQAVLSDDKLPQNVSSIGTLVTNACPGGAHGQDPWHASEIRSISADASRAIASAQTAIANIWLSIPPELRN